MLLEKKMVRVRVMLLHSALVVEDEKDDIAVQIICLDGLAVRRKYDVDYGFAI